MERPPGASLKRARWRIRHLIPCALGRTATMGAPSGVQRPRIVGRWASPRAAGADAPAGNPCDPSRTAGCRPWRGPPVASRRPGSPTGRWFGPPVAGGRRGTDARWCGQREFGDSCWSMLSLRSPASARRPLLGHPCSPPARPDAVRATALGAESGPDGTVRVRAGSRVPDLAGIRSSAVEPTPREVDSGRSPNSPVPV
jgi:hypothetical protein